MKTSRTVQSSQKTPKQRTIVKQALAIDEFAYTLNNISADDKKAVDDYTDTEIIKEAKYVLGLFINSGEGHINGEAFRGEEGPDQQKWAKSQVTKLRTFIKRFEQKS